MPNKQDSAQDNNEEETLQLHKEELKISKKWVETADVKVYKNTYSEEKQILVPVTREELIIEKKIVNPEGAKDAQIETIRIPLSEDRIEVTLHPTVLEDVEIYQKQYKELIHVNETVREEKVHIDTVGDLKVIGDDQSSTV